MILITEREGVEVKEKLTIHTTTHDQKNFAECVKETLDKVKNPIFQHQITFLFDPKHNTSSLHLKTNTYIEMSCALLNIMGISKDSPNAHKSPLDKEKILLGSSTKTTNFSGYFDPHRAYDSLWIYSNVCSYRMVGETLVPLLRVVPVDKKKRETSSILHKSFGTPQYFPISQNYIHTIDVYITDTQGKPIPFNPGQVVATLHFKKK